MIERATDYRRIKRLVSWTPAITNKAFYMIENQNGKDLGLWMLEPYFNGLRIHADLGKECRGKKAVESAKAVFNWVFQNTENNVVYAEIPKENKPACRIAAWAGMRHVGIETDKRIFEIKKEALIN